MEEIFHVVAAAASSEDPAIRWTGLGLGVVMLLAMALRVYTVRKAEEDSRRYNEHVARLPEADRALLRKPKGVPPGLHVVCALLLGGAAAFAVAPGAKLVREVSYCPPRCPPGEECVEGGNGRRFCGKHARPKPPPPEGPSEPESAALLRLAPQVYRRDPFVPDPLDY